MKNIPRLFINQPLSPGATGTLRPDQTHYLSRVMRTDRFLAFNNGVEYEAKVSARPNAAIRFPFPPGRGGRREAADGVGATFNILSATGRMDPSGKWIFYFSPIKKIDDLISGAVQMGAGVLQPVITDRTTANHINWDRIRKIIVENCEQSGRNSLPELSAPVPFSALPLSEIIYGDERKLGVRSEELGIKKSDIPNLLIGPEGGFSDAEFAALDAAGATGVSLGPTILRAETAAVALAAKIIRN